MMRSRRALLGLLVGAAAATTWSTADALSAAPWTCKSFPEWVEDWDAIVRARVETSAPLAGGGPGDRVATARTTQVLTGRPRATLSYTFRSTMGEDDEGRPYGYQPQPGDMVVIMLNDRGTDWGVGNVWPAKDFYRLAQRCGLT